MLAVRFVFNDFLQNMPIQCQIGHQPLQSAVLVAQLTQLAYLEQSQVPVALLPDVKRRLADPHLPAYIRHQLSRSRLLERKQDLLLSKPRSLDRFLSLPRKDPGSTLLQF